MMSRRVEGITELMSVRDAARALDVHENTIRNWVDRGILSAEKRPGSGYRRIHGDSVKALLDDRVPTYHDLHIATADIPRTAISDLPFGYEVTCNRVGGWCLWSRSSGQPRLVAGEYDDGLRLDVGGHVIVDSLADAMTYSTG